jgi:hypothetical protein
VTTLNGKDFKFFSHGLCTEKQNILLQHMHEIDLEPRFRVNAYFHIISRMFWRRMFCFSVHSPWEKNLKSFPIKMVLSWKQCSCDVIERVYWEFQKCTCSDRPLFAPVICRKINQLTLRKWISKWYHKLFVNLNQLFVRTFAPSAPASPFKPASPLSPYIEKQVEYVYRLRYVLDKTWGADLYLIYLAWPKREKHTAFVGSNKCLVLLWF